MNLELRDNKSVTGKQPLCSFPLFRLCTHSPTMARWLSAAPGFYLLLLVTQLGREYSPKYYTRLSLINPSLSILYHVFIPAPVTVSWWFCCPERPALRYPAPRGRGESTSPLSSVQRKFQVKSSCRYQKKEQLIRRQKPHWWLLEQRSQPTNASVFSPL